MYSCMQLWFQIKRACPELAKVTNSEKIYEIILNHDLGETHEGDVSMTRQIKGESMNKKLTERDEIVNITSKLKPEVQSEILKNFDDFEADLDNVLDVDILVCKFIDALQGDQFALTFGNDLPEHSELINKIINKRFVPYASKLITTLKEKGHQTASEEITTLANYHLSQIREASIKIDEILF